MNELSYIDLMKLTEELQFLVNGKIDQIYMPARKEIILQLHVPNKGKHLLRMSVPDFLYLTSFKPETSYPPGYCVFLRKKIKNARIRNFYQIENERILVIELTTKDEVFELYIELFLKGNIILCKDRKIISPLENQNWAERDVRGGIDYVLPKKEEYTLKEKLDKPLVKFLAKEMNLGGTYAEEVCGRVKLDKQKVSVTKKDIENIEKEIENLKSQAPKGFIYMKEGEPEAVCPFEMKIYEGLEKLERGSFNEALDDVLTKRQKATLSQSKKKKEDTKKIKQQKIIDSQKKTLEQTRKKIDEATKKGELLYSNYATVKDVLEQINRAKEKYSWKDIKKKLEGHKIVKKVKEKEGKLVLELE